MYLKKTKNFGAANNEELKMENGKWKVNEKEHPNIFNSQLSIFNSKKHKAGFTLAEVLIALVVLGAAAALTVPALVQNTQKKEYVSALKKAYSTLSQATQQIITEEGLPKCTDGGWACSDKEVFDKYKNYLNVSKECGYGVTGCFEQFGTGNTGYKKMDGTYEMFNFNSSSAYTLLLQNGMQLRFGLAPETNCINTNSGGTGSNNVCAYIYIDVNGAKKPNQQGRDMFIFTLKDNGLYPGGCERGSVSCNNWSCACKVLREGAMNY